MCLKNSHSILAICKLAMKCPLPNQLLIHGKEAAQMWYKKPQQAHGR